jgi:hypothetical protein
MAKRVQPLERTLKYYRAIGVPCARVERWQVAPGHPGGGVRIDAWGFIDALAIMPDGIVAVQCCGATGVPSHKEKIAAIPEAIQWLKSGGSLHLHSWKKRTKPIGRSHWQLRWLVARLENGDILWEDMPLTV